MTCTSCLGPKGWGGGPQLLQEVAEQATALQGLHSPQVGVMCIEYEMSSNDPVGQGWSGGLVVSRVCELCTWMRVASTL